MPPFERIPVLFNSIDFVYLMASKTLVLMGLILPCEQDNHRCAPEPAAKSILTEQPWLHPAWLGISGVQRGSPQELLRWGPAEIKTRTHRRCQAGTVTVTWGFAGPQTQVLLATDI